MTILESLPSATVPEVVPKSLLKAVFFEKASSLLFCRSIISLALVATCGPIMLIANELVAILSNSDALGVKNSFKNGWFSHFDCLVLSHEVGILKPDKRIYQITLDELNLKAQDCLFIDDVEDILKPAREMGMETILFKSVEQLRKEFDEMDIYCGNYFVNSSRCFPSK